MTSNLTSREFADALPAKEQYTPSNAIGLFVISMFGMDKVWGIAPGHYPTSEKVGRSGFMSLDDA